MSPGIVGGSVDPNRDVLNRRAGNEGAKNAEEVLFAPSAAFAVEKTDLPRLAFLFGSSIPRLFDSPSPQFFLETVLIFILGLRERFTYWRHCARPSSLIIYFVSRFGRVCEGRNFAGEIEGQA